jgi:hypothetical protein
MPTIIHTIGSAGGRDFSTIAAWIAALPANLITDGNSYEGDCYNDSEFSENVSLTGHTTDAAHTITLTAGPGQSFRDNVNATTNALRYNQANGVAIKGNGYGGTMCNIVDANVIISHLQLTMTPNGHQIFFQQTTTGPLLIDSIIADSIPNGGGNIQFAKFSQAGVTGRNILYINVGGSNGVESDGSNQSFYNCTFVTTSASAPTTRMFLIGYGGVTLENCAVFGVSNLADNPARMTATTCATDLAATTGFTGSLTYANQFVNTGLTLTSSDFREVSGANLIHAGTTDSTNIPGSIDIIGQARGSAWDIGCWQFGSVAAPYFSFSIRMI